MRDVLTNKLTKRKVDVRFLDEGKVEKIGGDKVKQVIKVKQRHRDRRRQEDHQGHQGKQDEGAGQHPGRTVRVTGAKRDDLQAAMALLRKDVHGPAAGIQQLPRLTARPARAASPHGAAARLAWGRIEAARQRNSELW